MVELGEGLGARFKKKEKPITSQVPYLHRIWHNSTENNCVIDFHLL